MKKGSEAVARRYAHALLDVAGGKGEDEALRAELDRLAALYSAHSELRLVLRHPAIPVDKKTGMIAALLRARRPSEILARLLALLVDRDRVELLPLIARAYARLSNARKGVVEAEAASARALDESEAREVAAAVGRALGGKRVELQRRVDPGLMGGVTLRMEGWIYDGSVRARLRALRERLAGTEGS